MTLHTKRTEAKPCDGCGQTIAIGDKYGLDKLQKPMRAKEAPHRRWIRRICLDCSRKQQPLAFTLHGSVR